MDSENNTPGNSPVKRPSRTGRMVRILDEIIDSRDLLGSGGKVVIEHESMKYELRLTRQGKLILTK